MTTTPDIKLLKELAGKAVAAREYAHHEAFANFRKSIMPDGKLIPAAQAIIALCERVEEMESENKKLCRERNEAVTRVKTWEGVVCLAGPLPQIRVEEIREWGEGDGELIEVSFAAPENLTDILEELANFRALKGEP
jgi:hypothetical protein